MEDLKQRIVPFYTVCLTADAVGDRETVIEELLAEDFRQINTTDSRSRDEFKRYVPELFKLVPNLKCDIKEILQDGNKVTVRCVASGNPRGDFFGIPADGSKRFSILTIDVHTFVAGRIQSVYHLEDWTAAFKQLQA